MWELFVYCAHEATQCTYPYDVQLEGGMNYEYLIHKMQKQKEGL